MSESLEKIITTLDHLRIVKYFHVAGVAILVYDYFLTLSMEASLVWPAPWTPTKVLFYITRYLPFIDSITTLYNQLLPNATVHACQVSFQLTGWLFVVGITLAEVILTIRAWAVWGGDRRLTIGLPVFFAVCFIPIYAVLGVFLKSMKFARMPFPQLEGCFVTGGSSILSVLWVMLMIYDAGIFLVMLIKGIRTYKVSGNTGLFRVIFRDGLLYYMCIFGLSLANVLVVLSLARDLVNLLSSIQRSFHAILTCRVLLSLKDEASKGGLVVSQVVRSPPAVYSSPISDPRHAIARDYTFLD